MLRTETMTDLETLFGVLDTPQLSDLPDSMIHIACAKCGLGLPQDRDTVITRAGNILVREMVWRAAGTCKLRGWCD